MVWAICPGGFGESGDKPRPGPPPSTGPRRSPPAGFTRWTGPLIPTELGACTNSRCGRLLRAQRIVVDGRKSWRKREHAEFVAKAAKWSAFMSRSAGAGRANLVTSRQGKRE